MKIVKLIITILLIFNVQFYSQWELRSNGLPDWSVANALSIGNDGTFATCVRSADLPRPINISIDFANSWLNKITPENLGGHDIAVLDELNIWFCTGQGKIYYSNDLGDSWDLQFSDNVNFTFFNYIKFFDNLNGIALGDSPSQSEPAVVLSTSDGGINWISINNSYLDGEWSRDQFYTISFPDKDNGYFFGSRNHLLYKTADGGVTWDTVDLPAEVSDVYMLDFYDENLGMIVQDKNSSDDYLFRTNDGGTMWTKLPLATNTVHHDIEFLPGNPSNVWFTDYYSLFFSSDTGNSWQEVNVSAGNLQGRNIEFYDDQIGALLCDEGKFYFTQNNGGMVTSIDDDTDQIFNFALKQNYPNPFNPSTVISWQLPVSSQVTIKVFDLLGREVATLVNEEKPAGEYEVEFSAIGGSASGGNAYNLPSGIYFYRIQAGDFIKTRKMVLLR